MQRVNSFETLRGVLVICILIYHFLFIFFPQKLPNFKGAFLAVEVFFVLSGFLIIKMLISGKYDLSTFLWRRFLRLFPSLIFILISSYLIVLYNGYEVFSFCLKELFYGFLSIYNYFLVFFEIPYFDRFEREMLFLPLWSLSMEIHFYILSAIITCFISNRKALTFLFFILIILFSSLCYIYFNQLNMNPNDIYFRSEARGSAFFIGGLIALYEENLSALFSRLNFIFKELIFLSTSIIIGLMYIYVDIYRDWFFPFGFLIIDCLSGILILSLIQKEKNSNILFFIGVMSYPIFLWHYPVFIISKYSFSDPFIPYISIIFVFILSYFTHKLIEEPFRDLYKKNYTLLDELILKSVSAAMIVILISILTVYKEEELSMITKNNENIFNELQIEANETRQIETITNIAPEEQEISLKEYYEEIEKKIFLVKTEVPQEPEKDPQQNQNQIIYKCKAFLLGDSVMLGAAHKLTSTYRGIIIDAKVSRTFIEGFDVVKKSINTIKDCENVVIHLGNNGYPKKSLIEQLIQFIKENTNDNTNLFFVNLKASKLSWERSFNSNLYNMQEDNKIKIIDWYSLAREDILYKDGIHLNNKGVIVYTQMIANALDLSSNSDNLIKSRLVKYSKESNITNKTMTNREETTKVERKKTTINQTKINHLNNEKTNIMENNEKNNTLSDINNTHVNQGENK